MGISSAPLLTDRFPLFLSAILTFAREVCTPQGLAAPLEEHLHSPEHTTPPPDWEVAATHEVDVQSRNSHGSTEQPALSFPSSCPNQHESIGKRNLLLPSNNMEPTP